MSAFLMAVYFQGMDDEEVKDLTLVMIESGHKVDLSSIPGKKVDKHSTGGVGDTTSLLIAPIIAAAGLPFAKMSGRGLAHTAGPWTNWSPSRASRYTSQKRNLSSR